MSKCMWEIIKHAYWKYICIYMHICSNFTTFAVVLRRVLVCWHRRSYASVFPHHLWPPVEPWQGYCLQRSGPGRYSNQHLPAAQMRWWGLRWVTPRSDCWAAEVGWERANSAGRGTNRQLVRTWNQYNLEKVQNSTQPPPPNSHIHCAHSCTHRSDYCSYRWTISTINWLTNLTNCPTCIQLMTWFSTYSWAKPEAPLGYEGNFCSYWLPDYFPFCFNSTAVLSCSFTHRDHPIQVELILNIIFYYNLSLE